MQTFDGSFRQFSQLYDPVRAVSQSNGSSQLIHRLPATAAHQQQQAGQPQRQMQQQRVQVGPNLGIVGAGSGGCGPPLLPVPPEHLFPALPSASQAQPNQHSFNSTAFRSEGLQLMQPSTPNLPHLLSSTDQSLNSLFSSDQLAQPAGEIINSSSGFNSFTLSEVPLLQVS